MAVNPISRCPPAITAPSLVPHLAAASLKRARWRSGLHLVRHLAFRDASHSNNGRTGDDGNNQDKRTGTTRRRDRSTHEIRSLAGMAPHAESLPPLQLQ